MNLRILAVIEDREDWERLHGVLQRAAIHVNRVPSGAGALILSGNLSFDLIVVRHPLPDLRIEDFLAAIRTLESTSSDSPVLVLADRSAAESIAPTIDDELVTVVHRRADHVELQKAVSTLIGVAARCHSRMMVEIEMALEDRITSSLLQTENLSSTGVLLRGGRGIPVGTPVRFELGLPDELEPVAGTALVVRHTSTAENTLGIALEFAELPPESQLRLKRYVDRTGQAALPATDEAPAESRAR